MCWPKLEWLESWDRKQAYRLDCEYILRVCLVSEISHILYSKVALFIWNWWNLINFTAGRPDERSFYHWIINNWHILVSVLVCQKWVIKTTPLIVFWTCLKSHEFVVFLYEVNWESGAHTSTIILRAYSVSLMAWGT